MPSRRLALCVALVVLVSGCGGKGATATKIVPVVERDGIPFDGSAIPDEVLQLLADDPVVVIGDLT